ncbi:MAG TPA: hypothetical protein PK263_06500 [bacterium]|nr:hypothetical protein [bacterium]
MITFAVIGVIVCVMFRLLFKTFVEEEKSQSVWEEKEVVEFNFQIPRAVSANHRPSMPLEEREKRRNKLINEIYRMGFIARDQLEVKQREDRNLQNTPYSYLSNNNTYVVKFPGKPARQEGQQSD